MAKKKLNKKSMRRVLFLFVFSFIFFSLFCKIVISNVYKIYKLNSLQLEYTQKLQTLQNQKDELSNEIVKLKDPEYLGNYIRKQYLYTKNDEYVIKINETNSKIQEIENMSNKNTYVIVTSVTLLGIVVVYVIKKSR